MKPIIVHFELIFLLWLFGIEQGCCSTPVVNTKPITIKAIHAQSDKDKDLIEFIEEGQKQLSDVLTCRAKSVMVLGLSGTGKSTLIAYLNGEKLFCKNENGKWRIDLAKANTKIGHGTKSKTLYPVCESPVDSEYSLIDTPGFEDTRGIGIELANSFFRKYSVSRASQLKFIVLLSQWEERGQQLRTSIKIISKMFAVFRGNDSDALTRFAKSVGLVVTKVENENNSDARIKQIKLEEYSGILNEMIEEDQLSKNEEIVFKHVINNKQLEIFSNPKKFGQLSDTQRVEISAMIQRLEYVNTDEIGMRHFIDASYEINLLGYVNREQKNFSSHLEFLLSRHFPSLQSTFSSDINESNLATINSSRYDLAELRVAGTKTCTLEELLNNLGAGLVSNEEKSKLLIRNRAIFYFNELLSEDVKQVISTQKSWLSSPFVSNISILIQSVDDYFKTKLVDHVNAEKEIFDSSFQSTFFNKVNDHLKDNITQINNTIGIEVIKQVINKTINFDSRFNRLEEFLEYLVNSRMLSQEQNLNLKSLWRRLGKLAEYLPRENKQLFFSERRLTNDLTLKKLNELVTEYVKREYKNFSSRIESLLSKDFPRIQSALLQDISESNLAKIENGRNDLTKLRVAGTKKSTLEEFFNQLGTGSVSNYEKNELLLNFRIIFSLNQLLSDDVKQVISTQKSWLSSPLVSNIGIFEKNVNDYFQVKLVDYLTFEKEQFKNILESALLRKITIFYQENAHMANNTNDIMKLQNLINKTINFDSRFNRLDAFLDNLANSSIFSQEQSVDLKSTWRRLGNFAEYLPRENKELFGSERRLISGATLKKLNEILAECDRYQASPSSPEYSNGVLAFKVHFGNMSSIVASLQTRSEVKNLKSVRVYATNAFTFDADFKVPHGRYATHAPDLVVISPRVFVDKQLKVDLSCETVPSLPGGIVKAQNGYAWGSNGNDGKPGLPGYNAGSLLVLFEWIARPDNLLFIGHGGRGGIGQNGGDGANGRNGSTPLLDDYRDQDECLSKYNSEYAARVAMYSIPIVGQIVLATSAASCNLDTKYIFHRKEGEPGSRGGIGGRGGCGGLAGHPGSMTLLSIKNSSWHKNQTIVVQNGNMNARDGSPGRAALSGFPGETLVKYCDVKYNGVCLPIPAVTHKITHPINRTLYNKTIEELVYVNRCSDVAREMPPAAPEIDSFTSKTYYLRALHQFAHALKHSRLLEQQFFKSLIKKDQTEQPNVNKMIERVKVCRSVEFASLLPVMKSELQERAQSLRLSKGESNVMAYTLAAVTSLIIRHNVSNERALIVDPKKFIENTKELVKSWTSLTEESLAKIYQDNYNDNLKKKIEEALKVIDLLRKDVNESQNELNKNIADILAEIEKLKENAQNNNNVLIQKRQELIAALEAQTGFNILNILCKSFSLLGPKGALIGKVAEMGLSFVKPASQASEAKSADIKSGNFDQFNTGLQEFLKEQKEARIKKIDEELNWLEKQTVKDEKQAVSEVLDTKSRINSLPESSHKYSLQLRHLTHTHLSQSSEEQAKNTPSYQQSKADLEEKKRKFESRFNKASSAVNIGFMAVELFRHNKFNSQEIAEVEKQIKENAKNYHALGQLQASVDQFHDSLINEALPSLFNTVNDNNNSLPILDLKQFQLRSSMRNLRVLITNTMGQFKGHSSLQNTFARVEDALATIMNIYAQIETLTNQKELADYVTASQRSELTAGITLEYTHQVNELKRLIHASIIKERYEQAIDAFNRWSFPFFCQFTRDLSIINEEALLESSNSSSLAETSLTAAYARNLDELLMTMKDYESGIHPAIDNYIQFRMFDDQSPFYQWHSKNYSSEIRRLLQGSEVTLLADVSQAKYDAVKFSSIYLRIEAMDSSVANSSLDSLLSKFYVEMKHSGTSHFLLKNQKYHLAKISNHENVLLSFQYGCTKCSNTNMAYKKLSSADPLLSPYTYWQLRIVPMDERERTSVFGDMNRLAKQLENLDVRISLFGYGYYVNKDWQQFPSDEDECRVRGLRIEEFSTLSLAEI